MVFVLTAGRSTKRLRPCGRLTPLYSSGALQELDPSDWEREFSYENASGAVADYMWENMEKFFDSLLLKLGWGQP